MSMSGGSSTIPCHLCGQNSEFIHHVGLNYGNVKSFCTNCVLHLHPGSFCSICFKVFENPETPPSNDILRCMRCSYSTHASCIGSHPNPCALCVKYPNSPLPMFPIFYDIDQGKQMNEKAARAFLAACEISTATMRKAAQAARVEAQVKVKEATVAKEKAKKAAEHFNALISKENH